MENDLFILVNTDVNIFNNGENILDKYNDMSKRKSNLGSITKKYAKIYSCLGLKQLIKHHTRITCYTSPHLKEKVNKVALSALYYLSISLFLALGKSRE